MHLREDAHPRGPRRKQEIEMSVSTWVIVGLVAGFIASKLVIRTGEGLLRDLGLGVAGAVIGGLLFQTFSATAATGLDVFGLVVTFAGAGAALIAYHTFFTRIPQDKPLRRPVRKEIGRS
jgi:uncharacterized membrane protein YeaQ/YmgE (transglycosylase-associated protein family)